MLSAQLFVVNSRLITLANRMQDQLNPQRLAIGDVLKPVTATNVRQPGDSTLAFQSKSTLLFFISPRCKFCTESLPDFAAIYERVRSHNAVFAISIDPPDDFRRYVEANGIRMDAYTVSSAWARESRLTSTPTIVLVSADGHVKRVWVGSPTPAGVEQIVSAATAG